MILELRSMGHGHWRVIVGEDGLGPQMAKQILDQMEIDFTASRLDNMHIGGTTAEDGAVRDAARLSEILQAQCVVQKFLFLIKQLYDLAREAKNLGVL